eukprot:170610-Rhodomonas_salina.2
MAHSTWDMAHSTHSSLDMGHTADIAGHEWTWDIRDMGWTWDTRATTGHETYGAHNRHGTHDIRGI